MNTLRIIFMGTPEFAVPSLEILLQNSVNVIAVITAPDKPQGRGQKLTISPVKECALKYNVPVLQPTNLKSPDFQEELKKLNANLQIVVAFRMLPESVWSMPELGTFNLHASLLPQYRGAAPINWAIINGEKETGITTFFLKHEIDTGAVIFQEKEPIHEEDTVGTLYDRLMKKGAGLVLKTVRAIESGAYPSFPQSADVETKHAPKIFKETCEINWNQPSKKVIDFVRGLSPYPAAWTVLNGKTYKVFKAADSRQFNRPQSTVQQSTVDSQTVDHKAVDRQSGDRQTDRAPFTTDNKTYLDLKTSDGFVSILELQPEGKKRMTIGEFLRGNGI